MVRILSVIAVIYTSIVALMQLDMKKLIAYSSVAHMGFVTAGIFAFNQQGVEGAIFQMISHGLVSGALFLCVGVLYDRMHTKEIAFYGGLTPLMPRFALFFMIFTLAGVALPGTSGFVGEFLVLLGAFNQDKLLGTLLATGIVLGATYMLWLYARVMFGEVRNEKLRNIEDLSKPEYFALCTIAILVIILGVYPNLITDYITNSTRVLVGLAQLENLGSNL
jgi:NADH-quinone oxidoreductase subunit M